MRRFCCVCLLLQFAIAIRGVADEPPRVDIAGEALPAGAYTRFGSGRLRHEAKAVAFVDPKTLASFGASLRIWDAATGKMRAEHRSELMLDATTAVFSADGKTLVSAHMPDVFRVWDVASGKMTRETKVDGRFAAKVAFPLAVSAHGKRFASLAEDLRAPRIWSVATDEKPTKIEKGDRVIELAIAPDGSRVATLLAPEAQKEGGSLALWDATTGKLIRRDELKFASPAQVAFSPDGARIAVGSDGSGWAVRDLDGKEVWKQDSSDEVIAFQFTADHQLIVVVETGQVESTAKARLFDEATGKLIREWSLGQELEIKTAVSPDGKQFAITSLGRLRVWNLADGKEVGYSTGHTNAICTTCITPDGKFIASTDFADKEVFLWDVATGRNVRRFTGHTLGCIEIVFSPNGKLLASSSYDRTVRIWDVASGKQLYTLGGFALPIWHLRFLPDNESLAVAPQLGLGVSVYHCPTGKKVHELSMPQGFHPSALLRHADGRILVIDSTGGMSETGAPRVTVQVWDVMASRVVQTFEGHGGRLVCSVLSRDGRTVATRGDDGRIRLWELASGQQRMSLNEERTINSTGTQYFTFSPDGRTIASANRREPRVYLWDVVSGEQFAAFDAHERPMYTVEYTPDGRRLLTGSMDATLLGWDMTLPERHSRPLTRRALAKDDLTRYWAQLRDGPAVEAYQAKWALAGDPEIVAAYLRDKFAPAKQAAPEKIKAWLADLDSPKYAAREAAEKNLLGYVDQAEEDLRKLHEKSTGEVRKRIARILDAELGAAPTPDVLREVRGVELLETIGTASALDVLRDLKPGKVRARIAREAAATLKRIDALRQ